MQVEEANLCNTAAHKRLKMSLKIQFKHVLGRRQIASSSCRETAHSAAHNCYCTIEQTSVDRGKMT